MPNSAVLFSSSMISGGESSSISATDRGTTPWAGLGPMASHLADSMPTREWAVSNSNFIAESFLSRIFCLASKWGNAEQPHGGSSALGDGDYFAEAEAELRYFLMRRSARKEHTKPSTMAQQAAMNIFW